MDSTSEKKKEEKLGLLQKFWQEVVRATQRTGDKVDIHIAS
jgi:hypothetical protein